MKRPLVPAPPPEEPSTIAEQLARRRFIAKVLLAAALANGAGAVATYKLVHREHVEIEEIRLGGVMPMPQRVVVDPPKDAHYVRFVEPKDDDE